MGLGYQDTFGVDYFKSNVPDRPQIGGYTPTKYDDLSNYQKDVFNQLNGMGMAWDDPRRRNTPSNSLNLPDFIGSILTGTSGLLTGSANVVAATRGNPVSVPNTVLVNGQPQQLNPWNQNQGQGQIPTLFWWIGGGILALVVVLLLFQLTKKS
jgi:hypothetical protein